MYIYRTGMGLGTKHVDEKVEFINESTLSSQNLTEETKKEEDERLWGVWTERFLERLQREVTAQTDLETRSDTRTEQMNKVNPR